MRYVPTCVGVMRYVLIDPGTMSAFMRNSGSQKPWITSREVTWIVVGVFTGRCMSPETGCESFG